MLGELYKINNNETGFFYVLKREANIILNKKEELKILSVPVGFIIFMGCLQLGYYPMQFFQVSSTIVHIYTAIISVPLFIYGIIKIKKEDFNFLKHYEFYILIILIFLFTYFNFINLYKYS